MGIARKVRAKLLLGAAMIAAVSLLGYSTAFAAEPAPVITKTDISQAYSVESPDKWYEADGKELSKGKHAIWSGNTVKIDYEIPEDGLDSDRDASLELQRSTNPNSGFIQVGDKATGASGSFIDEKLPRSQKFYYRVVARYEYTDPDGPSKTVEKTSNVVSVRTSPKTLALSKAKVKTPKGWKSKLVETKKTEALFKKSKSSTLRLSWKKRTDVDGYYVYRVTAAFVGWKKLKPWHYSIEGIAYEPVYFVTSSKSCKRVKTLKANATSVTLKVSNKYVVKTNMRSSVFGYYYAVVPFVKQNGKVYLGDCKKAYSLHYDYGYSPSVVEDKSLYKAPNICPIGRDFKELFPFPLMK